MSDEQERVPKKSQTESPARHEAAGTTILIALLVGVIAVGVGVGAYFAGLSGGEDLTSARAAGAATGRAAGIHRGGSEGRAIGIRRGARLGIKATFPISYRAAYRKAFEAAGLDAPTKVPAPR